MIKHSTQSFQHQMKHLEVRQKYSAVRLIFNPLLSVSSGVESLHLMLEIFHLYIARSKRP